MIILGLSGGLGHDAAACLVRDGQVVAMAEEERFVRTKRARKLAPVHATLFCLGEAGVELEDVDALVLSWDPALDSTSRYMVDLLPWLQSHEAFRGRTWPPIASVEHHLAHAASSFFTSSFDDALILVVDGQGEQVSTTLGLGRGRKIDIIEQYPIVNSLGYFYESVTHYLGLGSDSAGKTMGLAAYGVPRYRIPGIRITDTGYSTSISPTEAPPSRCYGDIRNQWLRILEDAFGPPVARSYVLTPETMRIQRCVALDQRAYDIAASAQRTLEDVLLQLVRRLTNLGPSRNLVLSGGVALNCSANGILRRSGLIDQLHVFPAANDAGGALGAALWFAATHGEPPPAPSMHAYWGPAFDDATCALALRRMGLPARFEVSIGERVAELVACGKIVGWFQDRMEIGPRALGHRSILANPTDPSMVQRVNCLKGRESWRPLAPSTLASYAPCMVHDSHASPFMLQAFTMTDDHRQLLPAVTHVDGTTRMQTVTDATSPRYAELLHTLYDHIGVPVVLNTSFNDEHEPIICTPADAIRTFATTELDALALGSWLVTKESFFGGTSSNRTPPLG